MRAEIIGHVAAFITLLAVQALILNHIMLWGCATPFLYVWLLLRFRYGYPRWGLLLWAFALGLCNDVFTNTPGVGAATCTLMAYLQPMLLRLFITRDDIGDAAPSGLVLGRSAFVFYVLLFVFLYTLLFFALEQFSFFNWQQWLLNTVASTLLTSLLIIAIDGVAKR